MTPESSKSKEHGIITREDSVPLIISTIQRSRKSRFATFWRTAHHEAKQDLRTRGWLGAFWVLCYVVFAGLIYAFGVLATLGAPGSRITTGSTACAPDGLFYTNPDDFNFWHASGFFQITLGHGEMTFTQAKVVDVIWDVVIGRGGQALLTLVSWKVFTQYVTTSMQVAPVTFSTFRTIFVHGESTAIGVWRLLRDFTRRHALHSRIAMTFMIATMVFILAFPTLASAMTGYSANVQAFVQAAAGSEYLPFAGFRPLYYVIHDGDRISKQSDYRVMDNSYGKEPLYTSTWTLEYCSPFVKPVAEQIESCQLINNITDYVANWGSGGQNSDSTFADMALSPPTLNITTYSLPASYIYDHKWKMIDVDSAKLFSDPRRMAWVQDDRVYNSTDMKALGQCQPTKTYNWGFSFIQVILMIVLLFVWLIGTYTMYLRSHITMKKRGKSEVVGEYKAIFELSNTIQTQLHQYSGPEQTRDASLLTESQLRQRITKNLNGGSISFKSESLSDGEETPWRFKNALKKDAWWLVFLVMTTPPAIFVAIYFAYIAFSVIILPIPIIFAMYVRRTGRSGAVLVFWPVLVLALVQVFVIVDLICSVYYR